MPHLKVYEPVMYLLIYLIKMAFLPWPAHRLELCVTGSAVTTSQA